MNKSVLIVLIVLLISAAIFGVLLIPKPPPASTTDTPEASPTISQALESSIPSGWNIFSDTNAGLTFPYPPDWQVQTTGQSFREGDLFSILTTGQTQRPQTELYDGARFSVMNPVSYQGDLSVWMKENYENEAPADPERPPQYGESTFSNIRYETITVCGLGCFTYYHTLQNGRIYGFLLFAEGPQKAEHEQTMKQIMEHVRFL